jgi:protein O-GlcNAc transferase
VERVKDDRQADSPRVATASAIAGALAWIRRGSVDRALSEIEALVAREPGSAKAQNALGSVLAAMGQAAPAMAAFRRALALRPDYPDAWCNLGQSLLEDGQIQDAIATLGQALASGRAPVQALAGLGRACCLLGRHGQAARWFERASAHPRAHAGIHSQRCYASLLDPEASAEQVASAHRDYQTAVAAPLLARPARFANDRTLGRRLVLGYVSSNFRQHSVASFLEGLLEAHDRSRLELAAYSDGAREDSTTDRLRSMVDRFRRVAGMTHEQLSALVREDRVDVLVDLDGHMQPNRLPVFARRPAPVLLTYLGYPGTTGMTVFDGRITDHWADPWDDPARVGPEPLIRVEGGCLGYTPPAEAPEVAALPAAAGGEFTFACMADLAKVNDLVLGVWGEILAAVPRSRLLLKARALGSADVQARVIRVLAACGVSRERVELLAATASRQEHLATYGRVDLALDTFPYAGATTTCEALYLGVPVVTLAGDRHAGRLGVSILCAAGLDAWVARAPREYVALAALHAQDLAALSALRRTLRARLRASPLGDGARVARAIEHASAELFGRWTSS